MQIRPKTRAQLYMILGITLFWMSCGAFLALYKCVTYDTISHKFIFMVPQYLPLGSFVLINLIGPMIGGLVGGSVLVLVLNEKLSKKSYWYYLFVNFLFFFAFIFILNMAVSYFFYFKDKISNSDRPLHEAFQLLLFDPYAIRNIATWLIIAWMTFQGLKIYEKYGHNTLLSMFLGRYRKPHEVSRVFMFLDLSNSTSIAEELGNIRYFELLRDFFYDITDPILNSRGEIYQYVGDEIVVSWTLQKAISENPNCIDCFFRIRETLDQQEHYYMRKYGLLPQFKAAIHKGTVVVGEIGVIKKEIVYSGDILNTTARMMEQCKIYDQKLIISGEVVALVSRKKLGSYTLESLGEMTLRGKVHTIGMYGLRKV